MTSPAHLSQLNELGSLVSQTLTSGGNGKDEKSIKLSNIARLTSVLLSDSTLSLQDVFEHVPNLSHGLIQAAKLSSGVNPQALVSDFEKIVNNVLSLIVRQLSERLQDEGDGANENQNGSVRNLERLLSVVIEKVSENARSVDRQKEYRFCPESSLPKSSAFLDFILCSNDTLRPNTFSRLTVSARSELLHQNEQIFNAFIRQLRRAEKKTLEVSTRMDLVEPLCEAAADDVKMGFCDHTNELEELDSDGGGNMINVVIFNVEW